MKTTSRSSAPTAGMRTSATRARYSNIPLPTAGSPNYINNLKQDKRGQLKYGGKEALTYELKHKPLRNYDLEARAHATRTQPTATAGYASTSAYSIPRTQAGRAYGVINPNNVYPTSEY